MKKPTSGSVFLDTNVLVYANTPSDWRHTRAVEIVGEGGVISVQVLNEFANVGRRKMRRSWSEIVSVLAAVRVLCPLIVPLDVTLHEHALRIADEAGWSMYDSAIVAAALQARCATLYSEDLQDGRVFDGRLTVRNPFASLSAGSGASR